MAARRASSAIGRETRRWCFGSRLIFTALLASAGSSFGAAENYRIDPDHTYPSIEFSHMGISIWRGKFDKTSGNVTIDRASKTGTVEIVVQTASLDFGLDKMNEYARKEEWFNVANYPQATYNGTLRFAGDAPVAVEGHLTLLGVTRPVQLTINSFNCIPHPLFKREVCGADAEADLNWSDFGMRKYGEGDTDKVHLRIQVEALKQE